MPICQGRQNGAARLLELTCTHKYTMYSTAMLQSMTLDIISHAIGSSQQGGLHITRSFSTSTTGARYYEKTLRTWKPLDYFRQMISPCKSAFQASSSSTYARHPSSISFKSSGVAYPASSAFVFHSEFSALRMKLPPQYSLSSVWSTASTAVHLLSLPGSAHINTGWPGETPIRDLDSPAGSGRWSIWSKKL